ncbi:MAG: 6-phosphofructokinase [Candidatus Omnitrophica bacterium]|nr:6-phosphofructokinase [Candidatus Omnitrophota bacterium]MDD5079863.1 6-phosphofructokinase [Candidatus Omnitrophota bacterium]
MSIRRIGVLTSGGDSPGMNAAVRAVVRAGTNSNLEMMGIFRGYSGLINEELKVLDHRSVSNIISRGGTILKTARCPEFLSEAGQQRAVQTIKKFNIDGLALIGGDGTYHGGIVLSKKWNIPCIGIPGTIDNDINGTDSTIGADTAVNTALDAIDKIRDTVTSMERVFVVEVMGRESGFIAMQVSLAGGTEDVLIPERKFDLHKMCHDIVEGNLRGKVSWIVVVAEGAAKAEDVARQITEITTLETRVAVLGHVQRGGAPTAKDRILASRLGAEAVKLLAEGVSGKSVGVISDEINIVDLEFAITKKEVNTDNFYNLIRTLT